MTITMSITTSGILNGAVANDASVTVPLNQLLTLLNNIANGAQNLEQMRFAELGATPSTPGANLWKIYFRSGGLYILDDAGVETAIPLTTVSTMGQPCEGRLTLTSGTPITTTDVTAATTIYFTPYKGNRISLYDGSGWDIYTFTERSLSLSGLTADTNYDVFIYDNSGVLTLQAVAWTNSTTRATAITLQDGIYVQSGSLTRRYLGTFRTTSSTGQTEDSLLRRYVWNYYNRTPRTMLVTDSTDSWTYATASYRSLNNSTNNRVQFVVGVNEEIVELRHYLTSITQGVTPGIALDATNANNALLRSLTASAAASQVGISEYRGYPGIGYHYLQLTEQGNGSTATIYGDAGVPGSLQMGGIGQLAA